MQHPERTHSTHSAVLCATDRTRTPCAWRGLRTKLVARTVRKTRLPSEVCSSDLWHLLYAGAPHAYSVRARCTPHSAHGMQLPLAPVAVTCW